nr:nuclear transport factor 2 family protein [Ilumatobacteraceae bacterium]
GWITWNADVYDTGAFRVPPPEGAEAPPLPPPPSVEWVTQAATEPALSDAALTWLAERADRPAGAHPGLSHDDLHAIVHHPVHGADVDVTAALLHPEAVYLDPLFGDFTGRDAIHAWLADVMPKVGRVRFDTIGPTLFNGSCSAVEWVQMGVSADGDALPMMRGTSVRRFVDGWITYAADYFDTAVLADPAVAIAGRAAGSTLGPDDIARYRSPVG